jgi:cell wall-associated NlpC family hydrolase
MKSLKPYLVAGLAALFAAAQAAVLATVSGATLARALDLEADHPRALTPPERTAAVWVGGSAAGLGVARVDPDRVVVTGAPYRIELRLPVAARREAVGLAAAQIALGALGAPYQWGSVGGRGGASGFDCSGLIWRAFASQGVTLPRVSREQARAGVPVPRALSALEPGDLLAFSRVPGGAVEHVGLYVGAGRFVHSSGWDGAVVVTRLAPDDSRGRWWWQRWVSARRVAASL